MKVLTKKTIKKMKKKYDKKLDKKYKKYKKEQKEKAKQEKYQLKFDKRVEEFGYAIDESKILKKLKRDRKSAPFYILLSDLLTYTIEDPIPIYHPYCNDGKVLLNVLESEKGYSFDASISIRLTFIINTNIELHDEFSKLLYENRVKSESEDTSDDSNKIVMLLHKTPHIKVREPYKAYTTIMDYKELISFMNDILSRKIPNFLQFTKYSSHSIELYRREGGKSNVIGYILNDLEI